MICHRQHLLFEVKSKRVKARISKLLKMPRISVCFQFVIVILFVKTNFASDKLINNSNEVMPEKTPWNGRFEPCFDEELNCPDLIKNGECFGFFIDTDGKPFIFITAGDFDTKIEMRILTFKL